MSGILVVEDEAIVAKDLEATLCRLGYEVPAVAARGDEAVQKANDVRPDLVLMDIHLKGDMDGIEAATELRRQLNVPVIYLTAYADDDTIRRARLTEPGGYLVKPFNERELRSAIEIALYRHSSEEALRDRARRFESTLRSLGEAVVSADVHGAVTSLNPAAERLTGWSMAEAIGHPITQVCPIERQLDDAPESDGEVSIGRRIPSVLCTREGRRVPIEDAIASIHDDDQSVMGLVLVLRDVGAERDADERIALSDRLSSIAAMASGISHEINNPLAYVIANLDFAFEDLALLAEPEEGGGPKTLAQATRAERIEQIRVSLGAAASGAQRIRRVIQELRSFADPGRSTNGQVDLAAVLNTAALVARPSVEERARLRVEVALLPPVRATRTRLVQAFGNLIVGAAGSIPPGNAEDNEVRLIARTNGEGRAEIEVSDTGAPMGPYAHRHLFDPFFARRASPMGSGLGMWLAHRVLTEHGATLRVESHGDRGNRIIVTLSPADLPAA